MNLLYVDGVRHNVAENWSTPAAAYVSVLEDIGTPCNNSNRSQYNHCRETP